MLAFRAHEARRPRPRPRRRHLQHRLGRPLPRARHRHDRGLRERRDAARRRRPQRAPARRHAVRPVLGRGHARRLRLRARGPLRRDHDGRLRSSRLAGKLNLPLGEQLRGVRPRRPPAHVARPASSTSYDVSGNGFLLGAGFEYRVEARRSARRSLFVDYTVNKRGALGTDRCDLRRDDAPCGRSALRRSGSEPRAGARAGSSTQATIAARQWSQRALTPAGPLSKFLRPLEIPVTDAPRPRDASAGHRREPADAAITPRRRARRADRGPEARQGVHPRRPGAAGPVGRRPRRSSPATWSPSSAPRASASRRSCRSSARSICRPRARSGSTARS